MTLPWLSILALVPAVGGIIVVLAGAQLAKQIALATSLVTLLVALVVSTYLAGLRAQTANADICSSRSLPFQTTARYLRCDIGKALSV